MARRARRVSCGCPITPPRQILPLLDQTDTFIRSSFPDFLIFSFLLFPAHVHPPNPSSPSTRLSLRYVPTIRLHVPSFTPSYRCGPEPHESLGGGNRRRSGVRQFHWVGYLFAKHLSGTTTCAQCQTNMTAGCSGHLLPLTTVAPPSPQP